MRQVASDNLIEGTTAIETHVCIVKRMPKTVPKLCRTVVILNFQSPTKLPTETALPKLDEKDFGAGSKMTRRVILHIGGEKTGTTTLQKYLSRNAETLKRRGIHYLDDRTKPYSANEAHFPVAACLISDEVDFIPDEKRTSLHEVLKVLKDDIARLDGTIILSCEHLSSRLHSKNQLLRLQDALATEDVQIVCYVREQSELALTSWATAVRYGCDQKFSLKNVVPENPYYNFFDVLNLWNSVFDHVSAREYRPERLANHDICADFFELTGLDARGLETQAQENKSLDLDQVEILRFLNLGLTCRQSPTWQFAQADDGELHLAAPLRAQFDQHDEGMDRSRILRHILLQAIPAGGNSVQQAIRDSDREEIRKRFKDANQALSSKYIQGGLSDNWFPGRDTGSARELIPATNLDEILRSMIIRLAEENANLAQLLNELSAATTNHVAEELAYLKSQLLRLEDDRTELKLELEKVHSTTTWKARKKLLRLGDKVRGKKPTPPKRGQASFH